MNTNTELIGALRRYWGYDSFRPLQEKIVRSLLDGRDNCVVMPTGGGKSLCYQLPAALTPGRTVIVISPLIALMQDQVAQLTEMGIPAAVLNSTLVGRQRTEVMRQACKGDYRLLYISPERLANPETIEWLRQVPIAFFAIDEAHCISEWGHEFRPDYRQLSRLRQHFPDRPIAAFTASATQRVRQDILDQLQLRDPGKHIASFHRRNLRYIVKECAKGTQPELLLRALRNYDGSNVIVYAPTIARVEETVDWLEKQGIAAIGYHGKMEAGERRRNQERWMSDEVRVLVGTIAFGLGINKAAVRAVIHLALPKSIEQFYQEAGRAGRDGLEADCVLLWRKQDAGLLAHFAAQFTDAAEKERAWQRYHEIRDFAESKSCRHRQICAHFGERVKWTECGACDACGCKLAWLAEEPAAVLDKTSKAARETIRLLAQGETLEGIARIRGIKLSSVMEFVAEMVECGQLNFDPGWLEAKKLQSIEAACARLGYERLSPLKAALPEETTYGEIKLVVSRLRSAPGQRKAAVAEEERAPGRPATVVATTRIVYTRSAVQAEFPGKIAAPSDGAGGDDEELREYLREWRRAAAKEQGVAAFVVMHDTTLDELCRVRPNSLAQLRDVSGFGERKTARYGPGILDALKRFRAGERAAAAAAPKRKAAGAS
ncbi:MAG: ATP-dependent DNA helicase RecQ [Candidatus Acidiferrales bacterium]